MQREEHPFDRNSSAISQLSAQYCKAGEIPLRRAERRL
jgi:hypothetical protein